ncbi:MAG: type I-C CRISPR-associated protein Cas8c/Csd1 [Opitutales bacterium]
MILQALYDLYKRLSADPKNGLPKPGYSIQSISFCIVLRKDGSVVKFRDARNTEVIVDKKGKEKKIIRPIELLVPGQTKPTGQGINPCTMWDNLTYLAGYPQPDKNPDKAEKYRVRAPKCFEGSKEHHQKLLDKTQDEACRAAVVRYFEKYTPETLIPYVEALPEDARKGNGVFQLTGETQFAHTTYLNESSEQREASKTKNSQCLITGEFSESARLHEPKIKTFDPKGSLLVSFNEKAYESYGKEDGRKVGQGNNAPVSEKATFGYCNALNWLLSQKTRRFRIGETTAVFWTANYTPAETLLPWMLSGTPDGEDDATKKRVANLLEKIARGTLGGDELGDEKTQYYVLGLSPNASRLSIRFWHTSTLGELIDRIRLHLNQLEIVRSKDDTTKYPDPKHPSVYQLLRQTARDADGIPPLLGGALMRSILLGTKYPNSLPSAVINRIRAERQVTYLKAAILKAWLIRNHLNPRSNQTMTTALDPTRSEPAYHLGRLFAVYEHAQNNAHDWKLERTIRHTMYSAASSTPLSVFGRLERLHHHHTAKKSHPKYHESVPKAERLSYISIVQNIQQHFKGGKAVYPPTLNLSDQSFFAVGYYHQLEHFNHLSFHEQQDSE